MARVTRRKFLKVSGAGTLALKAGGMAGILATGRAPAYAQTTTVHWLRWNDFVPACDQLMRQKLLPEAEKSLGIKVNYETVNGNDLQPRITAGIQSGAGPDLIMLFNNHPHLYKASLVDLTDVAEEVSKAQGAYYKISVGNCSSGGKYFSMPMAMIGAMNAYRKSLFAEVGLNAFPKTWDEYRDAGKKLKAKGYPIGQSLGQSFGDPPTFVYPLLWSFGSTEIDDKGKVVLNSKETVEAVKWMVGAWKDAFDEGGLAWDDASNNRAFLAGTICSTLNGASIYIESVRKADQYKTADGKPLKDDILHAPLPGGPKGQFGMHTYTSHVMPSYTKNEKAAKDLLRFIHTKENYDQWFTTGQGFYTPGTSSWETHAMWKQNPVMEPFAVAGKQGLTPGYPGEPNAKAAEVLTKYLLGNMVGAAIKGQKAEDAVAACDGELKKIYGA
ncbi:MAG TPA: extracellular solute-binding protein [Hyphomicrobiaceae bacterium]|nr:extracellular solute-binding protein [Hyphomicrobiaceae bacterium]